MDSLFKRISEIVKDAEDEYLAFHASFSCICLPDGSSVESKREINNYQAEELYEYWKQIIQLSISEKNVLLRIKWDEIINRSIF